jgi:hypothetical protein
MITSPVFCYEPPSKLNSSLSVDMHHRTRIRIQARIHPLRLSIDGSRSGNEAPLSGSPSR